MLKSLSGKGECVMAVNNKDAKATFMEALDGLKEYAKVNGNIVTKDDVKSYFNGLELDDNRYSMIMGYLMANNITINGVDGADNEFLHMLESTKNDAVNNDDNGIAQEDTSYTETDDGNLLKKINDYRGRRLINLPEKRKLLWRLR